MKGRLYVALCCLFVAPFALSSCATETRGTMRMEWLLVCDTQEQVVELVTLGMAASRDNSVSSVLDMVNHNAGKNVCGHLFVVFTEGREVHRMRCFGATCVITRLKVSAASNGMGGVGFYVPAIQQYTVRGVRSREM